MTQTSPIDATIASRATRRRTVASRALAALAALVMVLAGLAVWSARQVLDTNEWVTTSSALVRDSAIQDATARYLADQLTASAPVQEGVKRVLPSGAAGLSGLATGAVGDLAQQAAKRALASGAFQQLWADANRVAHGQLVRVIEGDRRADVVLDLRPMLERLATRVGVDTQSAGALRTGQAGRVVLLAHDKLDAARTATRVLRKLAAALTILALILLVASVWVGRGARRDALLIAGIAIAVSGLTLLAIRKVAGDQVVSALTHGGPSQPAVSAVWQIGTGLLRDIAGSLVTLGVIVTAAAVLAGPARLAVRARQLIAPAVTERPAIAYSAVLAAVLLLVASGALPLSGRLLGPPLYIALGAAAVSALRRQVTAELARGA